MRGTHTTRRVRPRYTCDGCGRVASWSPHKVCARCAIVELRAGRQEPVPVEVTFPGFTASLVKLAEHLARERLERSSRVGTGGEVGVSS